MYGSTIVEITGRWTRLQIGLYSGKNFPRDGSQQLPPANS